MRLLVCGGRHFDHRELLEKVLDQVLANSTASDLVLVHTGAMGAAAIANAWARGKNAFRPDSIAVLEFKVMMPRVDLTPRGIDNAMTERRRAIFDEGKPQVVFFFPMRANDMRTDEDLVEEAERRAIPVRRFRWTERLNPNPAPEAPKETGT